MLRLLTLASLLHCYGIHMTAYKKAWFYIGAGVSVLLITLNSLQYAEPGLGLLVALAIIGAALIVEGVSRRNRWLSAVEESKRRFAF